MKLFKLLYFFLFFALSATAQLPVNPMRPVQLGGASGTGFIIGSTTDGRGIWQQAATIDATGATPGMVVTYSSPGVYVLSTVASYSAAMSNFTATGGQTTYTNADLSGKTLKVFRE